MTTMAGEKFLSVYCFEQRGTYSRRLPDELISGRDADAFVLASKLIPLK